MTYIGIDIGKSKHCIAAIDERANILLKPAFVPQQAAGFEQIAKQLRELGPPDQVKVGMEASGHYWVHFFNFLTEQGWTVELFNPVLSCAQTRTHLRGRKTDKDDAIAIAKALRDGGYTPWAIPSGEYAQMKLLCRQRSFIVSELSNAKRRLTGLVDLAFPELPEHFSDTYGKAPLAVLERAPSARDLLSVPVKELAELLHQNSGGRHGETMAKKLRAAARKSIALSQDCHALRSSISLMIEQLNFFATQLKDCDKQIESIFEKIDDPIEAIPGIGAKNGPVILSELGELSRFKGGYKKLLAFAGLDPRIRESGQWKGTVKMSKRGSPALRTALFQAASMGRLHNPDLQAIYHLHRHEKGKNHRVAISHVARKIVQIIWATCRNKAPFDPSKICLKTP
jgi:transposase